ncbi:alpha/beta hydrolase family protein [Streptomyces sp. NPDC059897]|uniref:alpha/beta hydrolase family protein n=1 Tax=Streptomyces sp. NPDC059897 TaxID=3346994 RepID=UPI00365F65AB
MHGTTTDGTTSRGVRAVTLDSTDGPLSALLSEPSGGSPRAAVVALHGGGMRAGYFDSTAHPDLSLLTLGARLGYTVLALDRPGYGHSAERSPEGRSLDEQTVAVRSAVAEFAADRDTGAGVLLLGHSYGGKLALSVVAASAPDPVVAVDVSGCGRRPAADPNDSSGSTWGLRARHLNWGPSRLYPPGAVGAGARIVAPMPPREAEGVADWERRSEEVLPRIRVPVRLTFAEYEAWWRHTDEDLDDLRQRLAGAPRVALDRLPGAGHNISLGLAARTYHLRALAFLEESLHMRKLQGPPVGAAPGSTS